jgi:hypothetical protein
MTILLSAMLMTLATLITTENYTLRLASATYLLLNLLNYHPLLAGQL